MSISPKKVIKLVLILKKFSIHLEKNSNIAVHNHIDQFYYMTKVEELDFLLNKYERDPSARVIAEAMMDAKYREAYAQWKVDVRWYSAFNRREKDKEQNSGTNADRLVPTC